MTFQAHLRLIYACIFICGIACIAQWRINGILMQDIREIDAQIETRYNVDALQWDAIEKLQAELNKEKP